MGDKDGQVPVHHMWWPDTFPPDRVHLLEGFGECEIKLQGTTKITGNHLVCLFDVRPIHTVCAIMTSCHQCVMQLQQSQCQDPCTGHSIVAIILTL